MDVRIGAKDGRRADFEGVEEYIRDAIKERKGDWAARVETDPSRFESVELEVHATFRSFADEFVAGLLNDVTQTDDFENRAKN